MKSTRIREEQGDSDGKEKGLNQLKLSLWENDKGESDAQEEASLRLLGKVEDEGVERYESRIERWMRGC